MTESVYSLISREIFFIFVLTLLILPIISNNGLPPRPAKDKRENACLRIAIKFYNFTMDFEERMLLSVKREYFEDILNKDGIEVKQGFDDLKKNVKGVIVQIESWGGVRPKMDNSTNAIDKFTMSMEEDYKTLGAKSQAFAAKLLEAHKSLIAAKKKLMAESAEYADMKTKFLECKPRLDEAGIVLSHPKENSAKVTTFDISILLDLERIQDQISEIEDKITPIMEKYEKFDDVPPESEDYQTVLVAMGKMDILENVQQKDILVKNDAMLRQYERILNEGVNRALERLSEVSDAFDDLQKTVLNTADEHIGYDRGVRNVIRQYNGLLEKANMAATKLAMEAMDRRTKSKQTNDEL